MDWTTHDIQSENREPPRTRRQYSGRVVAIAAVCGIGLGTAFGSSLVREPQKTAAALVASSPTPVFTPLPNPVVEYELDGEAEGANLTLTMPSGTSQLQGRAVPLQSTSGKEGLTMPGFSRGDFVYFSAQNTGAYGDLTCRIKIDGVVISENTTSGAYAIATWQGTVA